MSTGSRIIQPPLPLGEVGLSGPGEGRFFTFIPEFLRDRDGDCLDVIQNVLIRVTQYAPSPALQVFLSRCIILVLVIMITAEFEFGQSLCPQYVPKQRFCSCLTLAKLSSTLGNLYGHCKTLSRG